MDISEACKSTIPLHGFRIVVDNNLAGSKRAVKMGDAICVSPSMWKLMKNSTQDELIHLLSKIELLDIGSAPSLFATPSFSKPPSSF